MSVELTAEQEKAMEESFSSRTDKRSIHEHAFRAGVASCEKAKGGGQGFGGEGSAPLRRSATAGVVPETGPSDGVSENPEQRAKVSANLGSGLPPGLRRVLEDAGTVIPADMTVWELLGSWAKTQTASGSPDGDVDSLRESRLEDETFAVMHARELERAITDADRNATETFQERNEAVLRAEAAEQERDNLLAALTYASQTTKAGEPWPETCDRAINAALSPTEEGQ